MSKMMEMEVTEEVVAQSENFAPSYTAEMLDQCWPAPVVLPAGAQPRRVFGCMTEPCRNKIHRRVKH
ncbi:MAG: hypothetical protein RL020_1161 [Pseudomonadota bacterium]|jgi:hypothetical protein